MKNKDRYKTAVADLVTARARPAYPDGDEGERVAEDANRDVVGRHAVQLLETRYLWARVEDRPQKELDDLREAICLANGWRFEP